MNPARSASAYSYSPGRTVTPYRRRPPAAGPGYVGVITQTEARGLARNAAAGLSLMADERAALKGKPRPPKAKPAREPEAVGAGAPFDDLTDWRP